MQSQQGILGDLCGEATAFRSLRTHARQGSNPVSRRQLWSTWNLVREPVLDSHALPSPLSLSVDFTVQQRPYGPQTYIKATARFRGKMASHLSPSPTSFRGTFDPISTAQLWQSCALATRRAR